MTKLVEFNNHATIDASSVAPPPPAPTGVVIQGTTAVFEQTNSGNANATFLFTGLPQQSGPGNIYLNWGTLTTPGFDSCLLLYNYGTGNFNLLASGVTYVQTASLSDYISTGGELIIQVWLNLATGTLDSLNLNY